MRFCNHPQRPLRQKAKKRLAPTAWSSRRGAAKAAASPLVKPDVRISRIRLARRYSLMDMHGDHLRLEHQPVATAESCLNPLWAEAKTEHASSCATILRQGPFAPPELPDFHATMNPSDFRRGQITVIYSRGSLPERAPRRTSQVPGRSVAIRRPQPPRGTAPLHLLIPSRCMLASPYMEGWPLPDLSYEAESGSLALRLTASADRGFVTSGHPVQRPIA